ncbi:MAG: FAD binding domain-containing protein [Elusimicrobia bacterium]|nr:FAD binding domain-containing protein [Elusimicrobiota bacterium]
MPSFIVRPKNLRELWKIIPALPLKRKYLAGGTDLVNISNAGSDDSDCWLDISSLGELRGIKETKKSVFIGAAVKISEIENSPLALRWLPALIASIPHFASPSLRNMATLGGNAANASPCADGVCALVSERALVCLELKGQKRKMPLSGLFLGPKKTALKKDEIITGFEIPKWKHTAAYQKLGPRSYFGISKVAVAVSAEIKTGAAGKVSIALASVGPVMVYAAKTSAFLSGKRLAAEVIAKAAELVKTEVNPITDTRSEADYRREMCGVLVSRALQKLRA